MANVQAARKVLQENNLDAVFVSSPLQIGYITNFFGISPTERESFVLVTKTSCYILTSPLYLEDVKMSSPMCIPIELSAHLSWVKAVSQIAAKENLHKIGFEDYNLTVAEHKFLMSQIPNLITANLRDIRSIKNGDEIIAIQRACKIGDDAFSEILETIKPGITEIDLAFSLETIMRKYHATPSFPTIAAFGPHAAVPHHRSGNTPLTKNQFVLLDFGVQINNFCSDMTRTVYLGSPSGKEKNLYQTVKNAQQMAIDYLQKHATDAKILASEVDKIARNYILSQGFPDFPHSLGHGIGLEVHEYPSLSPFSKDILKQGMVFSIEPGIYETGNTGVRIEDLVTLTDNSLQQLTLSTSDLIVL